MTVVFDAGQNSAANFDHLPATGLHYVGSVPPSDCPDLAAPARHRRTVVDPPLPGGLTAIDTRRGSTAWTGGSMLTHSQELHDEPGPLLHRHHPGQGRPPSSTSWPRPSPAGKPAAPATRSPPRSPHHPEPLGAPRSSTWHPDRRRTRRPAPGPGTSTPRTGKRWKTEVFGKHDPDHRPGHWPVADVVAGYRSQSEIEFGFRQLKDPHVVSFSPMHHWTEQQHRASTPSPASSPSNSPTCMRHQAHRAGPHLTVRGLLGHPRRDRGNRADLPTQPAADPKHAACSPKPTPPRTPSPSSSTSTATHPVRSYTHSPPKQQQHNGKPEPRPCSSETQARRKPWH